MIDKGNNSSLDHVLFAKDLSKTFSTPSGLPLAVLDRLSFSLPHGQIVSFLGASGCGKTTLLRILAGLEPPTSGSVESGVKLPGREMGFLYQGERLLPWRTALENVALGLELLGSDRRQAELAAQQEMTRLGMRGFEDTYPAQLSGGMSQRVLLARTFVTKPKVLFLDEPLGQLDIVARRELGKCIRDYVRESNAAALLVTHSVEEAIFISDVVLTLSRRPARIVDGYSLSADTGMKDIKLLSRENIYETIMASLLGAIGDEDHALP